MQRLALASTLLTVALIALQPAHVMAQNRDQRRLELNDAAIDAMIAGDHARAVELLEESIELGELNITWLNLGRAYAKAGRCIDAINAYDRMALAPRVSDIPADELYEVLENYRAELLVDCPGRAVFRCSPRTLTLRIDGAEELQCSEEPLELAAGSHEVSGYLQGAQVVETQRFEVQGMATTVVELSAPGELLAQPTSEPRTDEGVSALFGVGVGTASVGAALLLTFVIIDVAVLLPAVDDEYPRLVEQARAGEKSWREVEDERDRIESLQVTNNVLLGVGVGLLAAGAAMTLIDLLLDDDPATPGNETALRFTPQLSVSPQGGVLHLGARF